MCNTALKKLKWKRLVHEPCIYRRGEDPKTDTLMCRQVDNKLFGVFSCKEFDDNVTELKGHMNIEGEPELCTSYNGSEIDQQIYSHSYSHLSTQVYPQVG